MGEPEFLCGEKSQDLVADRVADVAYPNRKVDEDLTPKPPIDEKEISS
jgi:hypothetical protein